METVSETAWRKTAEELSSQLMWVCREASKISCPPQKPDCQHKSERDEIFCGMCWLKVSEKAVCGAERS